jgi:two-component system phosphate regulon sensor histidine kinase PhoR
MLIGHGARKGLELSLITMRKPFIWPLIGVSTLALIGLIFLQLYWIDSAIKLRRERFKQNVNAAMIDVTKELEQMRRFERFDADERFRKWMEEMRRKLEQGRGRAPLKNFMRSDPFSVLQEDEAPDLLDSLIRMELRDRGIRADYRFGVFDRFGNAVHLSENAGAEKLRSNEGKDVFMGRLFPGDPFTPTQYLRIYFPDQRIYLLRTMWIMLMSAAALILVIILAFSYTIHIIFRQKKLSEIKNDLIGNMTHEFKTPISTISLACEALQDPDIGASSKREDYVRMIRDENKRLGVLVENVLRSAVLDRGELKMKWEELDIHRTIEDAVHNIRMQVEKRGGKLERQLEADRTRIQGDRVHLVNVIYNLLDNALKYSSDAPDIAIRTRDGQGGVILEVADSGIGIKKEEQQKIFDRLYRVPTGNVHNVKGTGLGLSYVKVIVDKHGGRIDVQSEPGRGTVFRVELPASAALEKGNALDIKKRAS